MWEECADWHEYTYSIYKGHSCCTTLHLYWESIFYWVFIQLESI